MEEKEDTGRKMSPSLGNQGKPLTGREARTPAQVAFAGKVEHKKHSFQT